MERAGTPRLQTCRSATSMRAARSSASTLHDAIVARVRDMIIEGELAPGTRLHEGNIGKMLGVSARLCAKRSSFWRAKACSSYRQARAPWSVNFQQRMSATAPRGAGTLEGLAGQLAYEHASDAEILEVRHLHDRMMDMYAKRDRMPYFKLNQNIHSAILRLSKNEALISVQQHSAGPADADPLHRQRGTREVGRRRGGSRGDDRGPRRHGTASAWSKVLTAHMEKTWERVNHPSDLTDMNCHPQPSESLDMSAESELREMICRWAAPCSSAD